MSTTRRLYDRREILAAAAGAAAVAGLPFSSFATPALGAPRVQPLADWTIDDQWGVVPRWDAIPCVPQHRDDARLAFAHPVDRAFLV
jgi:3'-phosphoadenosine 5'-phosphosulfate sulfotransferase (PAPS reductase)/FAD synthetase